MNQEEISNHADDSPPPRGANIAWHAIGAIKMANLGRGIFDLLSARLLTQTKREESYKVAGMNWGQFVTTCGISRTHADRIVNLYEGLGEGTLEAAAEIGLTFRDLQSVNELPAELRPIVEMEAVIIPAGEGGEEQRIPASRESRDLIQAAISRLHDRHRAESRKLKDQLRQQQQVSKGLERQIGDLAATKDDLEKRLGDRTADEKELAAEVQAGIDLIFAGIDRLSSLDVAAIAASPAAAGQFAQGVTALRSAISRLEVGLDEAIEEPES